MSQSKLLVKPAQQRAAGLPEQVHDRHAAEPVDGRTQGEPRRHSGGKCASRVGFKLDSWESEPQAAEMRIRASNLAAWRYGVLLQRLGLAFGTTATALCLLAGCASRADRARLNQAQVIGTHN